jgi:hypothetical protein
MRGPALDQDERGQQNGAGREEGDGQAGRPRVSLGVGEAVDQAEETAGSGGHSREVDPRARALAPAPADQAPCGNGSGNGEDQVHVQAPAPGQGLRQHAAEEKPD